MNDDIATTSRTAAALFLSTVLVAALLSSNSSQERARQPGSEPASVSHARKGRAQVGSARKDSKLLSEALATLREALRQDPKDPSALFGMGWALQEQGKESEALAHYEKAIEEAREIIALSKFNSSFASERRGDTELALSQLEEAIAALPGFKGAAERLEKLRRSRTAR